jgi:hypothetical protein
MAIKVGVPAESRLDSLREGIGHELPAVIAIGEIRLSEIIDA